MGGWPTSTMLDAAQTCCLNKASAANATRVRRRTVSQKIVRARRSLVILITQRVGQNEDRAD